MKKLKKRVDTKFIGTISRGARVVAMCNFNNRIIIATTDGVYYLDNRKFKLMVTAEALDQLKLKEKVIITIIKDKKCLKKS